VVNNSVDDTELERLLMQLLRVVAPAVTAEPLVPGRAPGSSGASVPAAAGLGSANPGPAGSGLPGPDPAGAGPGDPDPAGVPDAGIPAVSASEARALIELISARGIAQGELARVLGLEKSTVSRLAAGLERKGWVRRGRDGENQRYVRLYLTPEGRGVAVQVWAAWQSRQARILGSLSAEERAGLSAGLRGLVRGLAAEGLLGEPDLNGRADPVG
jgi:DNA-binding MarR family transcriptional regulator